MSLDDITSDKMEANIHEALDSLLDSDVGSDDYTAKLRHLAELYKLNDIHASLRLKFTEAAHKRHETDASARLKNVEADAKEKEMNAPRRVSPDTIALVAANLVGIALILSHERLHVVASKAIGFIIKPK